MLGVMRGVRNIPPFKESYQSGQKIIIYLDILLMLSPKDASKDISYEENNIYILEYMLKLKY